MTSNPSTTLPKAPKGWVYTSLTLAGPGGTSVTVRHVGDGAYRVTSDDIEGTATADGLRPAIDKALDIARGLSAIEEAKRAAEAGQKALAGLLGAQDPTSGSTAPAGASAPATPPGKPEA